MGHPTPLLTENVFAVSPATGRLEGPWPYGNRPGVFAGPVRQGQQGSALLSTAAGTSFSDDFTSYPLGSQLSSGGNGFFGWKSDQSSYSHIRAFGRPGGSGRSVEFAGTLSNDASLGFVFAAPQFHVFFSYYVYWPSGTESPSVGPAWSRTNTLNNKFIRFGDGTDWAGPSTFRCGASSYGTANGSETIALEVASVGEYLSPGQSLGTWPSQNLNNNAPGVWKKIEWEIQMNTTTPTPDNDGGHGIANGITRMWIDGVRKFNFINVGMAPANSLLQQGYLFGAMNGAPSQPNSLFYMTDFAVSSVGRI